MSRMVSLPFFCVIMSIWLLGPGCGVQSNCTTNLDCSPGTTCQSVRVGDKDVRLCVSNQKLANGSVCSVDGECQSNLCYSNPKTPLRYCTKPCDQDNPCTQAFTCQEVGPDLKVCLLPSDGTSTPTTGCKCGKEGVSCSKNGQSDCDDSAGFFCLSQGPSDDKATCVRSCKQGAKPGEEGGCQEGYTCSQSQNGGLFVCVKAQYTQKELGGDCSSGGKAECVSGFFCYSQWADDPLAFCSKYCNPYKENDCGTGFICESPRDRDPWLCIPKGTKEVGGDCTQRGFLDCQSGLCAKEDPQDEKSFCTQSCQPDNDDCPTGFTCRLFGSLYRYLCSSATGGAIGSLCTKNGSAACKSGICISPGQGAINKICSQPCDGNTPCPGGYVCDEANNYCIPQTGKKQIGESCTSPQECVFGTCASDTSGKQFCTQRCTSNDQCPTNYECRNLEFTQKYCLPKRAGDKKLGEPCPNGPGDCESGNCLADPLNNRTFCTQPCDEDRQILCPKPYICKRLNDREAYCTPEGYNPP